jgi:O-antigen/teichoic acid export membrane protein|tara:strand:- start:6160 stop:7500 length:1341 start_codon:yes stop_codon:yes gene_type:complete
MSERPEPIQSKNKFTVDVFYMGITKIFLAILKISMSVITARFLGPAGRGVFFSFFQASGITNTIFTISLGEGLIYNIGNGTIKQKNVFGTVIFLSLCFGLFISCILFLILPILQAHFLNNVGMNILDLSYFIAPAMMFEYFSNSALRGLKLFTIANKISISSRITVLVLSCFSLYFFEGSIYHLILWFGIALLINCVVYAAALLKASNFKLFINYKNIPETLRYSIRVHPAVLLTEIEYRADIFILLFFLDAAAVGIYSIGVTVAQLIWYASNSVNSIFFPHLASMHQGEAKNLFSARVIKFNFLINLFLIIILCLFGSFIINILYGELFSQSYFVLLILAPGLLSDSIGRNLATWLKGEGAPKILSVISILSLIFNIALNFIFIPKYGLYGAALASAITYFIRALALLKVYCKRTNLSIFSIVSWSKYDSAFLRSLFGRALKKTS